MTSGSFFSPIRAFARTSPVLRTSVPPMLLVWAPITIPVDGGRRRIYNRFIERL